MPNPAPYSRFTSPVLPLSTSDLVRFLPRYNGPASGVILLTEMSTNRLYWFARDIAKKCYRHFVPRGGDKERLEFYRTLISPGDLVFDVGANMGNRTRIFLKLGAKVAAVEPQQNCCMSLRSEFGKKISLFEGGAGAKEGTKKFYANDSNVLSSFSEDWIETMKETGRSKAEAWREPQELKMTTLDRLIEQHGVPKFVKIDVEGYELEVLNGLSQPVGMISFEYTVPERMASAVDCLKRIETIFGDRVHYNYAVAEKMSFASDKWLSADELIAIMSVDGFDITGVGDVYVRPIP